MTQSGAAGRQNLEGIWFGRVGKYNCRWRGGSSPSESMSTRSSRPIRSAPSEFGTRERSRLESKYGPWFCV